MTQFLLNAASLLRCAHGGQAQPLASNPRVAVMRSPSVVMSAPYSITGCAFGPPVGNGPCTSAQWATASQRLTSGGQPLLLSGSLALCSPTGTPLLIELTQTRVKGI
jgi:hypothetical protein